MDSTGIFPLLELPELVEPKILDYLTVKEVINFRLVSHSTLDWFSRYSRPHLQKRLKYKTIYFNTDEEIHSFVTSVSNLPFTRFCFRFDPSELSESEDIQQFMKTFSPHVRFLYVRDMNLCLTDGELAFYESLTSLESLRIEQIKLDLNFKGYPTAESEADMLRIQAEVAKARIPQNPTKTLKEFMFSGCSDSTYAFDFVRSCPNLKQFSRGQIYWQGMTGREPVWTLQKEGMKKMVEYFEERKSRGQFDFEFDFQHEPGMGKFDDPVVRRDFLRCVGNSGVRVVNFCEGALQYTVEDFELWPREELEKFLACICSLTGISPIVKRLEMPNLEELNFATDGDPGEGNVYVKEWNEAPTIYPQWPKLKKINGRVDAYGIWEEWEEPDGPPIDDIAQIAAMTDFLFRSSHKRTAVKEIQFTFGVKLEVPLTPEHFVTNFPNLEILSLNIHSFKKEDYSNLFQLLGKDMRIKRLKLTTGVLFDDETFTGPVDNEQKDQVPYFSTMKHLENFKLIKYPSNDRVAVGITDKLFTNVLAGMSLKSVKVTGHEFNNVTWKGVEKLIDGRFGETIQKFVVELADAPRSEAQTKYVEFLMKLKTRCEFNSRFQEPKRKRLNCFYY